MTHRQTVDYDDDTADEYNKKFKYKRKWKEKNEENASRHTKQSQQFI